MTTGWYREFFTGSALDLWRKAIPPEATDAEAAWLPQALAVEPGARLLDLPCGNGRLALPLARQGFRVEGVDIAAPFVAEGRAAAAAERLPVILHEGDLLHLEAREDLAAPFDGAYCFGNSFGYFDRAGTASFLGAVAKLLAPGARLVIDTAMAVESMLPDLQERLWQRVEDQYLLVEHDYDIAAGRLDTDYTFLRAGTRETRRASHWLYTVAEIQHMLQGAGFHTLALFSDLDGTPFAYGAPRLLLVAERTP